MNSKKKKIPEIKSPMEKFEEKMVEQIIDSSEILNNITEEEFFNLKNVERKEEEKNNYFSLLLLYCDY